MTKSTSTTTKKNTTSTKPKPKPNLDAWLQITREGNPDAPRVEGTFWIGSLNDAGHTVSLDAKSREELEQRATEILKSRGVEV